MKHLKGRNLKIGLTVVFGLFILFASGVRADAEPLTLEMVLTGLQSTSSGMSQASKNDYIKLRVNEIGVDFVLTTQVEKDLRAAGADDDLIETIRRKAPKTVSAEEQAASKRRQEEYNRQLAEYTKAIETNPSDAESYKKRALLHYSNADYRLALDDLVRAILIDPNDQAAKSRLDRILNKAGHYFYFPERRDTDSAFDRDAYVKGFISGSNPSRRAMMLAAPFYSRNRNERRGRNRNVTVNVLASVNEKGYVEKAIDLSNEFNFSRSATRAAKMSSFFESRIKDDWVIIIYEFEQ